MSKKASKSILNTLHIRCGHDIEDRLVEAGIEGHYLCFTDPAWLGPPPQFNAWVAGRAQLIAERTGLPRAQVREELGDSYWRLARAPKEYKRIVLWFEHDLYDQAALARVLSSFATRAKLPPIELIQIEGALGEMSAEQLLKLWPKRKRVTAAQMAQAKAVWSALCAETPESLTQLVKKGLRDLPFMKAALVRHLQELPWTGDGLSLTERQVLHAGPARSEHPFRLRHMHQARQRITDARQCAAGWHVAHSALSQAPQGGQHGRVVAVG